MNIKVGYESKGPLHKYFYLDKSFFRASVEQNIPRRKNKKGRNAKFFLFFSHFQMLTLSTSKLILVDATFKSAPPGFYQILTIIPIDQKINLAIPVAYALMQTKDSVQYEAIFDQVINSFKEKKMDIRPSIIICDFEYRVHKSLRSKFPSSQIRGCYFHLVKNWWKKCQDLGLKAKSELPMMRDIVFKLKVLVHLPSDVREKYFTIIKNLYPKDFTLAKSFAYTCISNWYVEDHPANFAKALDYTDIFKVENQFISTNNILEGSEGYNNRFNNFVCKKKFRISYIISKFLQEDCRMYLKAQEIFTGKQDRPENFLSLHETRDYIIQESFSVLNKLTEEFRESMGINILMNYFEQTVQFEIILT